MMNFLKKKKKTRQLTIFDVQINNGLQETVKELKKESSNLELLRMIECYLSKKLLPFSEIIVRIYLKFEKRLNEYSGGFLFGIFRFFFFLLKDIFNFKKRKEELRLYGIYGYFGLWGQGKTIAMTKELLDLRKRFGDSIYIMTNYHFKLQDFEFTNWEQLLESYDKPVICAWDEVQNEFNSRNFKSFPTDLLTLLTQNRKGNGIRIMYSAQRWERVDKVFRELTHICYECKTRFGRLTGTRGYHWEEYEQLRATVSVQQKIKIKAVKRSLFVQTDYLRSLFDSFKMLQSAKRKDYVGRSA